MHAFANKHFAEPWFKEAQSYLDDRYSAILSRFIDTSRYVQIHEENAKIFSYEYASILRDTGSVFSSVMDAFVKGSTGKTKNTNIKDYRKLLIDNDKVISDSTLTLLRDPKQGIVIPFYSLRNNQNPNWWSAYTNIKHSEHASYKEGNLENVITLIAALRILKLVMRDFMQDGFWGEIGFRVDQHSPIYINRPFKNAE